MSDQSSQDPYSYTAGGWLKNDQLQREARFVKFDFAALCRRAVDVCPGATEVVGYEKTEGSFNRVFVLSLDNGTRVVAKVPFRIAGPRRLATNSEVATMAYVRSLTKIPIPKVLDWCDDENSIGTEYIIMEHAAGVRLNEKWPFMNTLEHMLCVKNVALLVIEMAKLQFPAYGSLYFANAPIDPKSKIEFAEGFCIGPHCGRQYWDCNVGEARFYEGRIPNRGPWSDFQSYCSGLIDSGLSRIPRSDGLTEDLPYCGSVQEHLRLLNIRKGVIQELAKSPTIQNVAGPTLLHPDISKRNIFVSEDDPYCVTAIIDWQSTSVVPAFAYTIETPDLIEDPVVYVPTRKELLALGGGTTNTDMSEETEVEYTEEMSKHEEDVLVCRKTFEVVIRGHTRELHDARAIDPTLLRPFHYCDQSWKDSATALRQDLIDLSQRWNDLGLSGSCEYQPTPAELSEHKKHSEDLHTAQDLKIFLKHALDAECDGWVPADEWEASTEKHKILFCRWLESHKESGGSEDRARKLWPFDVTDA